ncbi:hypothetical protein AB0I28_38785 [Phytomonospora sp. NPDC050363]|uniref:hypothetical protein n=1 Tax=Phytomonospora sp. NPDC050363 TaxID=3155642 RepID=UPI0033EDF82C
MEPLPYVLDTTALHAYCHGSLRLGHILTEAAESAVHVYLPVLCLTETHRDLAYAETTPLRVLTATVPGIMQVALDPVDAAYVGSAARHLEEKSGRRPRLGLVQAAHLAMRHAAVLVTDSEVTELLPYGWPTEQP